MTGESNEINDLARKGNTQRSIVVVARISISIFTPLLTSTASLCHMLNFKYNIRIILIPLLGRHTTTASHSLM